MSERQTRITFSTVAWVFTVLCSLALFLAAAAVAEHGTPSDVKVMQP
jgi:hypothetical protein